MEQILKQGLYQLQLDMDDFFEQKPMPQTEQLKKQI